MPQPARFGTNLQDRKCSKCKKTKEPHDYELRAMVYRTCNHCRFKAYQRIHPLDTIVDFNRGSNRIIYIDTDSEPGVEYSVQDRVQALEGAYLHMMSSAAASSENHLNMSSSAAASSESYFVDEPEPEPEPDMD